MGREEDQGLSVRLSKEKPNPLQHPISLGGLASSPRDKCSIKSPNPTRFVEEEAKVGKCEVELGEDSREEEFSTERYAPPCTILSFSSSLLDRGSTPERLFGQGVSSIDEERELNRRGTPIVQTPLRVVMPDGEGEKNILLNRDLVVKEDSQGCHKGVEDLVGEDGEPAELSREESCLKKFSDSLGMSIEGFEGEFLKLMTKVNQKRIKVKGKGVNGSTKFDREIKKLKWTIKECGNLRNEAFGKEARGSYN